jgi:hypothetical protein
VSSAAPTSISAKELQPETSQAALAVEKQSVPSHLTHAAASPPTSVAWTVQPPALHSQSVPSFVSASQSMLLQWVSVHAAELPAEWCGLNAKPSGASGKLAELAPRVASSAQHRRARTRERHVSRPALEIARTAIAKRPATVAACAVLTKMSSFVRYVARAVYYY